MTDQTDEPMTILAEHVAAANTFDLIGEELGTAVHFINNSQDTRDRLELEASDELPEPIVLGIVVAFGSEAKIIWSEYIDIEDAVIAADFTQDVLSDAQAAYSKATHRLLERGETKTA